MIAYAEVSHGVIDSATVGIREIMQRALLTNAAGIILAHNHPGLGSTANPSTQDIDVTQGLMRACEIMGIHMFDHIIVAGNDYYSFREKHAELYVKREESRKKMEVEKYVSRSSRYERSGKGRFDSARKQ